MEVKEINKEWRLKSIEIQFKKGYAFEKTEEEKHDRYEGKISFENGEGESFSFRVKSGMAQKYIDLIATDIVTAATGLGERLKESLGLSNMVL